MLFNVYPLDRSIVDSFSKIPGKIRSQGPGQRTYPIKHKHIDELEAMDGHPFLCAALPQQPAVGNIIVDLVNVCIGVMDDIVFDLPNKGVTSQRIHRQAHYIVNPFFFREAVVAGVVHDIERDAYQCQPEEDRRENTIKPV